MSRLSMPPVAGLTNYSFGRTVLELDERMAHGTAAYRTTAPGVTNVWRADEDLSTHNALRTRDPDSVTDDFTRVDACRR
jgi:hypothetical protein